MGFSSDPLREWKDSKIARIMSGSLQRPDKGALGLMIRIVGRRKTLACVIIHLSISNRDLEYYVSGDVYGYWIRKRYPSPRKKHTPWTIMRRRIPFPWCTQCLYNSIPQSYRRRRELLPIEHGIIKQTSQHLLSACSTSCQSWSSPNRVKKLKLNTNHEWKRSQALEHKPKNSSFFFRCVSGLSIPRPNGPRLGSGPLPSGGVPISLSYSVRGRLRPPCTRAGSPFTWLKGCLCCVEPGAGGEGGVGG